MTLDELIEKVPERWRPVAAEYGPALLAMSADELWRWIDLLAKGSVTEAYSAILHKLDNAGLVSEWGKIGLDWQAANERNTGRLAIQREAVLAVLRVLLAVALTLVGL